MPATLFAQQRLRRQPRVVRAPWALERLERRFALAAGPTFSLNLQNWTGFQTTEAELWVVGYSGTDPRGASNNPDPNIKPAAGENMYLDASTNGTFASNFYGKSSLTPVKLSAITNTITIDQSVTIAGGQLIFFLAPAGQTPPAITVNQPIWGGPNPTAGGPVGVAPGATTYNGSPLPPWDIVELTQIPGTGTNTGLTIDVSAVSQWGMPIQLKSAVADINSQTIVGATMPASQSATPPFFRQDVVTAFSTFMSNANGSPGNYSGGSAFAGLPFGTATIGSQSYTFGIESPDNAIGSGTPDPGPSAALQLSNYFDAAIDTLFSAATGSIVITGLPAETGAGGKPLSTTYTGTLRSDANGAYFLFSPPSDWAGDTSKFRIYSPRSSLFNAVNPSWQVFANPGAGSGAFLTPYDDATGRPIPTSANFWALASQAGNQFNEALNRGVANLPNPGTATWSDQTKWYQQSQRSNLYAAFWHSATVGGTPAGTPFMRPPTPSITLGNGFTGLGAYAFSLDENPAGVIQAQVPSKLNEIANGGNVTIDVTFGPWKSNSTVTVNAPQTFTVVENTPTNLVWPASPAPFADSGATSLTVTLSVTGGTLALAAPAAATGLTVGGTSAAPTISGPITALNAYFKAPGNIRYTPITGSLVTQTLTTAAVDPLGQSAAATSVIDIVSTSGPVVAAPAVFTVPENTATSLVWPASPAPFADASSPNLTVTLSVTGGSIQLAPQAGLTIGSSPQGPTISGPVTALNAYFTSLGRITYTPIRNSVVGQTLTTIASDGTDSARATSAIRILVPTPGTSTVAAPIAFWVPAAGRVNLVWPRGLTPFVGRDARVMTVSLSTDAPAGLGSLAASRSDRTVSVVSTGDGLQLTGRPADLNRYFATVGRITYTAIGPSLQPRVLLVRTSDGGAAESALLVRGRGPSGVPAINPSATLDAAVGQPLLITYAQLVQATGATTASARSVEFLLRGVTSGRLELWDGAKWIRVPATVPRFKEPILAPGGIIRWTPPAGAVGTRAAFRVLAWDGWKMSAVTSQVSVRAT